jgi:predicted peroxiredoxin
MTLGILVTTSRHLADVIGITKAAVLKGHEVMIFIMDEAIFLMSEAGLQGLASLKGVSLSFCEASTKQLGFQTEGIPKEIAPGSQFNNAMMVKQADRVISL